MTTLAESGGCPVGAEYPYWRRNTILLAVGCFTAQIAFSLVAAFLPQYLVYLGLKVNQGFWSGMAISAASITYAVMAPIWGSLADRYGKRVMMLRSGLGITLGYFLTGLARDHLQVLFLRATVGLVSGYIPSAVMLTASNTPEPHLGQALGIVQTAVSLGTIAGPLVGGTIAEWAGLRGTFYVASFLIFAATVLPLGLIRETVLAPQKTGHVRSEVRQTWNDPRLRRLFIALFLSQAALVTIQPTLPLWIAQLVQERVALVTGAVYSLMGVSMALGAALVGRRMGFWGAERVFQWGFAASAALFVLQGLAPSVAALAGFRFLSGFTVAAVTVAGNLLVAQAVRPESRGMAFGVLNSITAIGGVAGPIAGGFLGDKLGLASPFFGSAALFAVAALELRATQAFAGVPANLPDGPPAAEEGQGL